MVGAMKKFECECVLWEEIKAKNKSKAKQKFIAYCMREMRVEEMEQ